MFLLMYIFVSAPILADDAVLISEGGKVEKVDTPPPQPVFSGPKISVDFQKADIHAVMRFFATAGSRNIIVDESITGFVTMRLENVYWEEAFLAVLWSKGLAAQNVDATIVVR